MFIDASISDQYILLLCFEVIKLNEYLVEYSTESIHLLAPETFSSKTGIVSKSVVPCKTMVYGEGGVSVCGRKS